MDLQVQQNEVFQHREWRWTRIGWAVMAAFVVAGLIGLLGTGPLSWVSTTGSGGLVTVQYQRVTHHDSEDSLWLRFSPDATQDQQVTVDLGGSWMSGVDLRGVSPEPAQQQVTPDGARLTWPVASPGHITVKLTFRPQRMLVLEGVVTVGNDEAAFTQYVLP